MGEHIDSCHKESESCAAHPEHSTTHLNSAADITADSDSKSPQKEKNVRQENNQ